MIDEINRILEELYDRLSKMPLEERIAYLKSWGLDAYPMPALEMTQKSDDSLFRSLLPEVQTGFDLPRFLYCIDMKPQIAKIEIIRIRKRHNLLKVKPISKNYLIHNYYVMMKHDSNKSVEMKDLIITFRVIYSDGTTKIRTINGDSEECKIYIKFIKEHND